MQEFGSSPVYRDAGREWRLMFAPVPFEGSLEDVIVWKLWVRCLTVAEAVPNFSDRHWADVLVAETRRAYAELGEPSQATDALLAAILERISSQHLHPSARVFEAALRAALPPTLTAWVN